MLDADADVDKVDERGWTPIMRASRGGRIECVWALLEAGAVVNRAEQHGWTALLIASAAGHSDCVRAFIDRGAALDEADHHGQTALMAACANSHMECVRALIEAGASVNVADVHGRTPLMYVSRSGHLECVRALLQARAAVRQCEQHGWTALMAACATGHSECVHALLEGGASANEADHHGQSALMAASANGHAACVHALLEAGANVLRLDASTASALRHGRRHLGVVQLLCAYGAQRAELFDQDPELSGLPAECRAWLLQTRRWTSQLHHLELLPAERVRTLIVEGANLHASDGLSADAPTPLTLARALVERDAANEAAQLVVRAAAPWSISNHQLFPKAARARAVELLLIGHLLTRDAQFGGRRDGDEMAILDVWQQGVMALAVSREAVSQHTDSVREPEGEDRQG